MAALMGGSLVLIAASAAVLVIGWLNANPSMIVTSMGGLVVAGILLLIAYVRSRRIVGRASSVPPPAASVGTRTDAVVPGRPDPEPEPASEPEPGPEAPVSASVVPATPHESPSEVAPLPVPGAPSVSDPVEEEAPAPASKASSSKAVTETGAQGRASTKKSAAAKKATRATPKTTGKTAASRGASKSGAATGKATAARKAAAPKQPPKVIVFDGRDKYHRPGCRFAKGRGAEKVTKATARRWGYEPCSICEP